MNDDKKAYLIIPKAVALQGGKIDIYVKDNPYAKWTDDGSVLMVNSQGKAFLESEYDYFLYINTDYEECEESLDIYLKKTEEDDNFYIHRGVRYEF